MKLIHCHNDGHLFNEHLLLKTLIFTIIVYLHFMHLCNGYKRMKHIPLSTIYVENCIYFQIKQHIFISIYICTSL